MKRPALLAVLGMAVSVAVAALVGRGAGALGMVLGLVGGAGSWFGLWGFVQLFGDSFRKEGRDPRVTMLAIFGATVKLPVLVGCFLAARLLPNPAESCFLIGAGLVYSAMIGWVARER